MRFFSLLLVIALVAACMVVVNAVEVEESNTPMVNNPASLVAWKKPRIEDIDHRDHQRVHATLAASHLDIAAGHHRAGRGPQTTNHIRAAEEHNKAAALHVKADYDPDFIPEAVKMSSKAYARSRRILRRTKSKNMVPETSQSAEGQQALKIVSTFNPALAPEALAVRQFKRSRGMDDN